MRDPVLERDVWHRYVYERARKHRLPVPRCPVCRTSYTNAMRQYSVRAESPQGRETFVTTCGSHYCRVVAAKARGFWPVDQTTFGSRKGNCFSACVAMMLDLRIEAVPQFMNGKDWWVGFVAWCRLRRFQPLFYDKPAEYTPPGYSIAGGPVSRSNGLHACLAFDGRVVWDPNPFRVELTKVIDYIVLVSLDTEEGRQHAADYDAFVARQRAEPDVFVERQMLELDNTFADLVEKGPTA